MEFFIIICGVFFIFFNCFAASSYDLSTSTTSSPFSTCLKCDLPDCLCPSFSAPFDLKQEDTPQLVLLTFDDAIEDWMYPFYEKIVTHKGFTSANGCPILMTFFVSHTHIEYGQPVGITNYEIVNRLYNRGHEIASHTVTHFPDINYWRYGSFERWVKEIGTQRDFLSKFANIPKENIRGFRAPYLEVNGDATFDAVKALGLTYDSSLVSTYKSPPVWPFTLDNGYNLNSHKFNWPKGKFEGIWEFPITSFYNVEGPGECKMPDFECERPANSSMAFQFFMKQFKLFNATRTLFGIYQHAYWFRDSPHIFEGFLQFLEYLSGLDDVYFVTMSQALEWLKNPLTTKQFKSGMNKNPFACQTRVRIPCQPRNCTFKDYLSIDGRVLNFTSCAAICPEYFPSFPVNGSTNIKTKYLIDFILFISLCWFYGCISLGCFQG